MAGPDVRGVSFPRDEDGRRSTTRTARDVFSHAVRAVDPALADAITAERDWRRRYADHVRTLTARAAVDGAAASTIARDGLNRLHQQFVVVDEVGEERPLAEAVGDAPATPLATRTITGGADDLAPLGVPYRGEVLRGDALVAAARGWVDRGLAEDGIVEAMTECVEHPEWFDLRGRSFALLGAGAEMGPTELLLAWGADVYAVDVPVDRITERLEGFAAAGAGTLHLPVHGDGATGADLLTEGSAIRAWIHAVDGDVTVGNYVYADGADFVRVAMAADAILLGLVSQRDGVSLAYLATPTDVFAVPTAAVQHARRRYEQATALKLLGAGLRPLTRGRALVPNHASTVTTVDGAELGIADCLVLQQGPNYALAKRLQRWRALVAHQDGLRSSVHVAPATKTRSVTKNRVLAAAYDGAGVVGVEPFPPATSRALMAALLVRDAHVGSSGDGADRTSTELDLTDAAVHSGLWRTACEPRSVLGIAVLAGARTLVRS